MTEKQLSAYIVTIAPRLVAMLMSRRGVTEEDAIRLFYQSELYSTLEREETKLWHFSSETLYTLLDEELTTGSITYPEEL